MIKPNLFKKPQNKLEGSDEYVKVHAHAVKGKQKAGKVEIPDALCVLCPSCKKTVFREDLENNKSVCPLCGHHFAISPRKRIEEIVDDGTFLELDGELKSINLIDFPGYDKKLRKAESTSGENEAVLCGTCRIKGIETCIFVMNKDFMMGSMGVIVGEKITRLFEYATQKRLPVVGYSVSGGARMQEGILSLMQMAKTSGVVKKHSDAGLLYIAILTDPTTGGVTASFAMEADITLAEPGALIGFAGPRVIEQTLLQRLPKGFQRAEFVLETGFLDAIVDRREQRRYLGKILGLHCEEADI